MQEKYLPSHDEIDFEFNKKIALLVFLAYFL